MKTSITFITHTATPGGAELALARYIEGASDVDVEVITFEDGPLWRDLESSASAKVIVLRGGLLGQLRELRAAMKRRRDRIFIGNSMRGSFYMALAQDRLTTSLYWARDQLVASSMSRVAVALTRWVTLTRVSGCLANSISTERTVRTLKPRLDTRVVYSPSGIAADDTQHSRQFAARPTRLVFLGRLAPWKGPDLAVRAVAALIAQGHSVTLTVAGGPLFGEEAFDDSLRALAEELGVSKSVEFLGHVAEVRPLLDRHDVLLHCSTVPEPFGQVIVQAMAAGLVVVAADSGGPKEIISDGVNGFLYATGDLSALTATVRSALEGEPSALQSLSDAARERARHFDDAHCITEITQAVVELGLKEAALVR
ncbi:glycosyltransferase [Microbacterium trichothecenolyticum]|uniref:D-inositol 3-phosphate glycosyltransferase n=1 Tax=Microbacterium trichothecenolyticum TaxID=69370 RepID=A0A0M2H9N3_MICTR|nr:glycosyltransferase [Microbacterium trichothecenolyticum]KJL40819.1 D-inositol 3-phosphate glycosyltransferase [Microbacterium trichothecenolyticum]